MKKNPAADAPKADLYEEITNAIVEQLEAGTPPWSKPWTDDATQGPLMPYNASTGREYRGINTLLLWRAAARGGFLSNGWMTFKQAQALGGCVRKGEKGTKIVWWGRIEIREKGTPAKKGGKADPFSILGIGGKAPAAGETKTIPVPRAFVVFNVAQIDGLPEKKTPKPIASDHEDGIAIAEATIKASGATIRRRGNRACYTPASDSIDLPRMAQFANPDSFYATAFHELTHWTGHTSRLNRPLWNLYGTPEYALEELVAELGAAFCCAELGLAPQTTHHAAYIGAWIKALQNDKRAIFRAATQARKAHELIARLAGRPVVEPNDTAEQAA